MPDIASPPQLITETTLPEIEHGGAPVLHALVQLRDFSAVSAFLSTTFEDRVRSLRTISSMILES
jgi:hypothetical protein